MSCHYGIRCLTCKIDCPFPGDTNHQDELMRHLIANAEIIGRLSPVLRPLQRSDSLRLAAGNYNTIDVGWFVEHHEHELVVVDEYGRIDQRCNENFRCKICGTSKWCQLPKDHDDAEHAVLGETS